LSDEDSSEFDQKETEMRIGQDYETMCSKLIGVLRLMKGVEQSVASCYPIIITVAV